MPAAIPLAASLAGSAAASSLGASFGLAIFGGGVLTAAQTAFASSIIGAFTTFAVNSVGGSLFSSTPKSKAQATGTNFQSGLKQVVRLSDDTYKLIYGKARIGGVLVFAESSDTGPDSAGVSQTGDNLFLHMVIVHACHEVTSFEELYLNDQLVTLDANGFVQEDAFKKDGKSYVRIKHHFGYDTQTANTELVTETPNWTTAHRLQGLAYTVMRLQWNSEVFTSGIPTFNAVIKGKKVYDPRTGLTAWSDNAALCIRDYLTSRDSASVPYGFGLTADEVDDSFTIAAANICDESVTKLDASTIARYTLNGVVDTATIPIDNLESMMSSMAGSITYPKGTFRMYAGAYDTPDTEVIDESWLVGPLETRLRIPRQDLFNAVRGTFISPENGWQSDDFPAVTSSTYEAEDNGERIYTDVELAFTTDPEAAQRIAKIIQRKCREQITVTAPCNYRALKYTVWDTVKVSNDTHGWVEKVFRITGLAFDVRGGVKLTMREENALSYDWSASDSEAVAYAPDTGLPSPSIVAVPTGVVFDSRAVDTSGGDKVYNLVLSWSPHSDAFVTRGGQFEIQYKLSADAEWRPSFFVDGDLTTSDIVSNSVNIAYDLRIRAVNMLGRRSGWVTLTNAMIGSSGGVGATFDYGDWTTSPGSTLDYGDWTTPPSVFEDYEAFT